MQWTCHLGSDGRLHALFIVKILLLLSILQEIILLIKSTGRTDIWKIFLYAVHRHYLTSKFTASKLEDQVLKAI